MINQNQIDRSEDLSVVNEAISTYVKSIAKPLSFSADTEDVTYSSFFENKMLIISAIRQGFPYKLFIEIKNILPFSEDDWAEYLHLSKKTLQRHSVDEDFLFKPIHTEKIIELAEVTNFGNEVFDSSEQFYLWLNTPSFALNNLKPAELLKDSYGKELVMGELNRIDQGIFA
ncbi:putative toxin-antitoxin system antitoxin component (TIGR02293 family) [Pedobacter sp. UYP30]|uniref:type II RES/Xre toxin-antitoxin system antitoxin n=1 Tax=Pedobacter sp. UYP30 TaxID=1756400 RepID=UPI00339788F6